MARLISLPWLISGLPVTRPAIRIGRLGIPRLLDEYIGDYALVETTKRILLEILVREAVCWREIAYRHPGPMKRAHVHAIVNVRRTSGSREKEFTS